MARRGEPSTAHEYDERNQCTHCGMYKVNVDRMSHACKPDRELEYDLRASAEQGVSLEEYRRNGR